MQSLISKPYTLYPLAAAIVIVLSLYSCAPSINDPGTPNGLAATPDTVRLANPAATGTISLSLRCGCDFTSIDSAWSGDTADIMMTPLDNPSTAMKPHLVSFSGRAGAASGIHEANYRFFTYDFGSKSYFFVTVAVFLTVP